MAADRKLNFYINVSRTDANTIGKLSGELRKLSKDLGTAAVAMNAFSTAAAATSNVNALIGKVTAAIANINTASGKSNVGNLAKQIDQVGKSSSKTAGVNKELNRLFADMMGVASQDAIKKLASEEEVLANTILRLVRTSTIQLQKDKEKLELLRRQKLGIDEVVGSEAALDRQILNLNNRITTNNNFIKASEKRFEALGISANQLGKNIIAIGKNYAQAANEVLPFSAALANAASRSKASAEEQKRNALLQKEAFKQAAEAAKLAAREQKNAANTAASAQKSAINEVAKAEKAYHNEKIRLIKLSSDLAVTSSKREAASRLQKTTETVKPASVEGIKQQQEALKAGKAALDAYDSELLESKLAIEKHAQVQKASADVGRNAAKVQKAAAREIAAARNLVVNGYNSSTLAASQSAVQSRKLAQEELLQSKKVLEQRIREFQTTIALRNKAAKAATDAARQQKAASSSLNTSLRNQAGLLDNVVNGFNRVVGTQLKYFGATLLVFGAITKLKAAFESILELQERTARAFAVSRSSALLFEERFIAIGETIEEVALRTGISINDVSEAMFQFGSAGLQAEESIAALKSTMDLIQATGAAVTTTTKTIAATYRLMGERLGDVGDLSAKFARINDIIAATYRDNQVEIGDFTQAMKFALPVSKQLNLTLEQTSGIIALLHNNFIRGGEAGRALRVIFSRMSRDMDQFAEAFGIALDPNKPIDFIDVMRRLSERVKEGSLSADQIGTVFERMGLRGANAFILLTQEFGELEKGIKNIEETSVGAAEQMARIRRETASGQLKIFAQIMLKLGREAILPLAAIVITVVRAINKFQEAISGTWIETAIKWIIRFASVLLLAKIAAIAFGLAVRVMGLQAGTTTLSVVALQIANGGLTSALWLSTKAAISNITALFTLKGAMTALTATAYKLGAALIIAFPYLAIAAAIAGVVYLINYLITRQQNLIDSNNERMIKIREEIREYQNQSDAIGNTIEKLEEMNEAYREGRTTLIQTRIAISEAVRAHGELGIAAGEAAGDIDIFISKAREQQSVIEDTIGKLREEEKQKFGENLEAYAERIKKASTEYKKLEELRRKGTITKVSPISGLSKEVAASTSDIKEQSNAMASYSDKARDAVIEIAKLAKTNGQLSIEFSSIIRELYDVADAMSASASSAVVFGDVFDFLQKSAENLSILPFIAKIEELGEVIAGLEGFRLDSLFKFDFVIPKEEIANVEKEIKTALD